MRKLILLFILVLNFHANAQSEAHLEALSYLSYLSSQIVNRPLNESERNMVKSNGTQAFRQIVTAWTTEPAFANGVQVFFESLMHTSAAAGSNDPQNLPGLLAKALARNNRPYSEILTSNTCYNQSGQAISCGTQAPFTAGVLTTQAFLVAYKGAYNISRASKMMSKFLCTTYPLPDLEEPRLAESELIPQFATKAGKITFGNGNNCYSCHSQFGLHAQFFVRFDFNGNYQASATGLQNPSLADGFSTNGLATSHLISPDRAKVEQSRILGKPAGNLAEAAVHITQSPRFLTCATQNLMQYYLRLSDQDVKSLKPELLNNVVLEAKKIQAQPGFGALITAIVANPHVYTAFKNTGARP